MRKGWPSQTAVLVSFWRGLGRHFPREIAHDPLAKELVGGSLAAVLEAADRNPRLSRALVSAIVRASGGAAWHLLWRTRAIDDMVLRSRARQVVLLGAGLDTRAYRLALGDAIVFEIDHPDTQARKREVVAKLAPLAREVRHVPVNFERDDLERALTLAGFAPKEPSAVVWEGVTMYLERAAIDATLRALERLTAPSSWLAITYYDAHATFAKLAQPIFRAILRAGGEPLRTRLSRQEMTQLLVAHGFERAFDVGDQEWAHLHGTRLREGVPERLIVGERI